MLCMSGPPCPPGEDGGVDVVGVLLVAHDDAAAAGADGLVGRAGDEVGDTDRRRVDASGHEAGDVGDVREVERVDVVGGILNALPLDLAGVCGVARDDDVGVELGGVVGEIVVVEVARFGVDLVLLDLVELAREVRWVAVAEVAAVVEIQREDLVAGFAHLRSRRPGWPGCPSGAGRWRVPRRTAPSRGRLPTPRPRRRTRSRHSSARRDSPRRTCSSGRFPARR